MKEQRRKITLHADLLNCLDALSMEQRGQLFTGLLSYGLTGQEPVLEHGLHLAFLFLKDDLCRNDDERAALSRKRSAAGKKGGRPRNPT